MNTLSKFSTALALLFFLYGCGGGGGGSNDSASDTPTSCTIGSSTIGNCEI